MRELRVYLPVLFMLCICHGVALAQVAVPDKLAVIGFDGSSWNVYVSDKGELSKLDAIPDPRSFSFHAASYSVAYIGSDAHLYLHNIESGNTEKLSVDDYIVQLPGGKSRRTEIVEIALQEDTKRFLVKKRTAQFEPYSRDDEHLYYSTAICVDDCEGMIWELWRRESATAKQYQLTLLNHVSNQPHLSADNWLYFSSNAPDGYFHIWRMRPEPGSVPEQLTYEKARDSEPFTDSKNNVYFIRKTRESTNIMTLKNGEALVVSMPKFLIDYRNLEVR